MRWPRATLRGSHGMRLPRLKGGEIAGCRTRLVVCPLGSSGRSAARSHAGHSPRLVSPGLRPLHSERSMAGRLGAARDLRSESAFAPLPLVRPPVSGTRVHESVLLEGPPFDIP